MNHLEPNDSPLNYPPLATAYWRRVADLLTPELDCKAMAVATITCLPSFEPEWMLCLECDRSGEYTSFAMTADQQIWSMNEERIINPIKSETAVSKELGLAESALAQPQMSFGGAELYPKLADKAAALCFSLVMNHPFVDGNKRIGHAAMETFLVLNGYELDADIDGSESIILRLAAGELERTPFTEWVIEHVTDSKT